MNVKGKRVLVTGISGTAGDRIATRFVREGASVTIGKSFQSLDREPERMVYVCDKIRAELGYRPVRSFEDTVNALVA